MRKRIIGFTGVAGSGKTTAARQTQRLLTEAGIPAIISNFAAPLKAAVRIMFLLPDEALYGTQEEKERIDPFWQISGREALQYVGTELFRNKVMKDFHTLRMRRDIAAQRATTIIIDDLRFQNEVDLVEELGGTVYGVLPENHEERPHTSPERTTEQWSAFYDRAYSPYFVDFIERLAAGNQHSSENPAKVRPDNILRNDHAAGVESLYATMKGYLF